jgi:hypothetical protein
MGNMFPKVAETGTPLNGAAFVRLLASEAALFVFTQQVDRVNLSVEKINYR